MERKKILDFNDTNRGKIWNHLVSELEKYLQQVDLKPVTPELNPEKLRSLLRSFDFSTPKSPFEAIDFITNGLAEYQIHTTHPRYFGLFNPAPTFMGIAADTIVAAFNPQLAAWSHSPLAIEIEQQVIGELGKRFGYQPDTIDGTFTSGGAEANHTAILTALTAKFPELKQSGLRGLSSQPVMYISGESHHSFIKAARLCGLGSGNVKIISVDNDFKMDTGILKEAIRNDLENGYTPFLTVATAGTTNAGVVDPIADIAEIARDHDMWFHVDAAWGGAAALVPELHYLLKGTELSDSITFDAHKFMSVPMGAGIYFTSHPDILEETFGMPNNYMPKEANGLDIMNPYNHSMQWSRRFIGLKVFLSLATAGWDGYAEVIRHQTQMGELLKTELTKNRWQIINKTILPVVCFTSTGKDEERSASFGENIAREIVLNGEAWISTTLLSGEIPVLRACITNYMTEPKDVFYLVSELNRVRESMQEKLV